MTFTIPDPSTEEGDGLQYEGGVNSSAPISTVVEPAIGRESPSKSTNIPTVLSPTSFEMYVPTKLASICKSPVAFKKVGSPETEFTFNVVWPT